MIFNGQTAMNTNENQSKTPQTTFAKISPPPLLSQDRRPSSHSPIAIGEAVKRLTGAYRKGEAEDATTYARSIALVLSDYPLEIVQRVTDPRIGLQSRSQWLPTVAEVKTACEAEMRPIREAERRRRIAQERYADRATQALPRPERPSLDELRQRYPDLLGKVAATPLDHEANLAVLEEKYAAQPIGDCSDLMKDRP